MCVSHANTAGTHFRRTSFGIISTPFGIILYCMYSHVYATVYCTCTPVGLRKFESILRVQSEYNVLYSAHDKECLE